MSLDRPSERNAQLTSHLPEGSDSEQAIDAFSQSYLVAGLNREQIQEILKLGTFRRLAAREFLVRAGESSADLFVILKGTLSVVTSDGEALGTVNANSVVGEVALCDAGKRGADVIANGLVDVVQLPGQALRQHLATHRDAGFVVLANLAKVLAARLRTANAKIDALLDSPRDAWAHSL